jgi:ssDNA-binding Zn-finger/Zn-ribbon topoisomerase 1
MAVRGKQHRLSAMDMTARMAICSRCGPVGIRLRSRSGGRYWQCGKIPKPRGPRAHGLTDQQVREFKIGKVCAICGSDRNLVIDHDHKTGIIRGVLCHPCNTGLGKLGDSIEGLRRAIAYLDTGA